MNKTQTSINAVLILALIASFTYTGLEGREPTHYCESRELKAHCLELSSTLKTCYTLPGKTGGKRCTEGWKEILEVKIDQESITRGNSKQYSCNSLGCTAIT